MRVLHGAIGMFGEAGEVFEAVVAEMNTGELDSVNVAEELGDSEPPLPLRMSIGLMTPSIQSTPPPR